MDPERFFYLASSKIHRFEAFTRRYSLQYRIRADHIGYKCGSLQEFEATRIYFESRSDFIYQSIISERRIAIIKLAQPISTCCGSISYLELSDQKPDQSQHSGFDHIEFFPISGTPEELSLYLLTLGVDVKKVDRPHHKTYDITRTPGFKLRIEEGPLIDKIVNSEIRKKSA
jgi:predicted metalloenzyme YecM